MKKLSEQIIIDAINKATCEKEINMDLEFVDSLEVISVLISIKDSADKIEDGFGKEIDEIRELNTVKTPRQIIDILKTKGLVE